MANKDKDLMESGAKVKLGTSDRIIRGFGYIFVTFYAICCIIPFVIIVSTSFTNEVTIRAEGVQFLPKDVTLEAYKMVARGGGIWWSYLLTIVLTVVGTFLGLSIISMTGYALQRRDFPFRNAISFYIYFTSLFSAGLAPYYLLMTQTYHSAGQLFCSAASSVDVVLVDYSDEELREGHSSRDYGIREDRRGRGL